MITISQTKTTNDIFVSDGDLVVSDGVDAYGIILADAVRTMLGEIQLDTSLGIDYLNTIMNRTSSLDIWRSSVIEVIKSYKFVRSIGNMDVSFSSYGRTLNYKIVVYTDLGVVNVEN